jgi:hypothetical protein
MTPTLALLAALSLGPHQAGPLTLTNVRATHGSLGPVRADNKVLPGDSVFLAFDIEGITVDPATGKVSYSMLTEIFDGKDKLLFKRDPQDQETINALGGNSVPAFVHLDCGLDQAPGEYVVKVTVTDRTAKRNASLSRKFQVLPRDFGLVRLATTTDVEGNAPAAVFGVGQALHVSCSVVSFERDKAKEQPDVTVELRVLDDKGKPVLTQPFTGQVNKDVPSNLRGLPLQFLVSLNRPGKFTVALKATDHLSKKTATLSFPLTVLPAK